MSNIGYNTVTDVAWAVGVSRQAVHQAIREDRIKSVRCGSVLMVADSEMEKFIASRKKKALDKESKQC